MKRVLTVAVALILSMQMAHADQSGERNEIDAVLNALHERAAQADFDGYFALFHDRAVFLGTDRDERWPLAEFKAYTKGRFDTGTGWTYHPTERFITVEGATAWFEERVLSAKYGETRGTGVLLKTDDGWKIAQYNLVLPTPNDLFDDVAKQVKDFYGEK